MEDQKWPSRLTLIRHAESAFNALRAKKKVDPEYQEFLDEFSRDPGSDKAQTLAKLLTARWSLNFGDHDTPLAPGAEENARITGEALASSRSLPDVVYVSPYGRTHATLQAIKTGWPELELVPIIEDHRIREQEHGEALLYNDWRLFFTHQPKQQLLRAMQTRYWYRYPQGENVPDVQLRLKDFQDTLIREHAGQDVLVITHHLTILAIRMNLERFTPEEFLRIDEEDKPSNCGVTTYLSDPGSGRSGRGKLVLAKYNECFYDAN